MTIKIEENWNNRGQIGRKYARANSAEPRAPPAPLTLRQPPSPSASAPHPPPAPLTLRQRPSPSPSPSACPHSPSPSPLLTLRLVVRKQGEPRVPEAFLLGSHGAAFCLPSCFSLTLCCDLAFLRPHMLALPWVGAEPLSFISLRPASSFLSIRFCPQWEGCPPLTKDSSPLPPENQAHGTIGCTSPSQRPHRPPTWPVSRTAQCPCCVHHLGLPWSGQLCGLPCALRPGPAPPSLERRSLSLGHGLPGLL